MSELRAVVTVDKERRIRLPEGVPFQPGEPLHLLWDGRILQVARRKPRRLSDAYARVQEQASRALETEELSRRLAEEEARRRKKFDDAWNRFFGSE